MVPVCARKTTKGKCCVFPFTYKGKTYKTCTKVGHSRPWCSLDAKYKGKWGNCRGELDVELMNSAATGGT